jgi:VanZ family protein
MDPMTEIPVPRSPGPVVRVLGALYLAFIAGVVFWPTPVDRPASKTIAQIFVWLHRHGVPNWIGYSLFEWLSNVAFFVPFGVLAVLVTRRVLWSVALGCGISTAIELTQWLVLPERTGSVLDVLANTSGALVGAAIAALWLRRRREGT